MKILIAPEMIKLQALLMKLIVACGNSLFLFLQVTKICWHMAAEIF